MRWSGRGDDRVKGNQGEGMSVERRYVRERECDRDRV